LRGTVTAAADSSPIAGARVTAYVYRGWGDYSHHSSGADDQGHYALNFQLESCWGGLEISLRVRATGFQEKSIDSNDPDHVRCTGEIQTLDFQLEAGRTDESLEAVWGTSSSDVYVVGGIGLILHYDGSGWSTMNSGSGAILRGVWGASSSDVYAVGSEGTILHYDGTGWTQKVSGTARWLEAVWGTSESDIYAVGQDGTILHYDGTRWTSMTSSAYGWLRAVWGSSSRDVYAVGFQCSTSWGTTRLCSGEMVHNDGRGWSAIMRDTLAGVWGTSSSDVYTVGLSGTILHYDGTEWDTMTSGTNASLRAVWGSSTSDIYAVGSGGTILHYDGTGWSAMTSRTEESLGAIWGTSSSDVYVVGSGTTILHYDGTEWRAVTPLAR
jgi:hypothetical protein